MQHNYVNMRLSCVCMQHNYMYVHIRLIYVNMQHNYVHMRLIMLLVDINRSHVNIIMLHVDINKSHVHIIMLQKYATIDCLLSILKIWIKEENMGKNSIRPQIFYFLKRIVHKWHMNAHIFIHRPEKKELQECSLAERIIGVKADEKRIRNVEHLAVRRKTLCIRFVLIAYVFHTLYPSSIRTLWFHSRKKFWTAQNFLNGWTFRCQSAIYEQQKLHVRYDSLTSKNIERRKRMQLVIIVCIHVSPACVYVSRT